MKNKVSEFYNINLIMIPVMFVLVASIYFIGYLGNAHYNWEMQVDTYQMIGFTTLIAIAYIYIVVEAEVIAFIMLMLQMLFLVLMLILQGIYGLFLSDEFTLSKKIFDGMNAILIFVQSATLLPVLIRRK